MTQKQFDYLGVLRSPTNFRPGSLRKQWLLGERFSEWGKNGKESIFVDGDYRPIGSAIEVERECVENAGVIPQDDWQRDMSDGAFLKLDDSTGQIVLDTASRLEAIDKYEREIWGLARAGEVSEESLLLEQELELDGVDNAEGDECSEA